MNWGDCIVLMDRILQIDLLGSFRLHYRAEAVHTVESSRLQALLAYLLLHAKAPQPRQQIAYHFWPVSSESQARTNLRKLFLQLRRALPDADAYLSFNNQTIQWRNDAPFNCDVVEVQQRLRQLRDNPLDRDALTELFDLYSGELLPNCYDDWIIPLRAGLHQEVMAALDQLVTVLENQRAYAEGIRYAQRLLTFDPLEEKAYQRLMRLRAFDGDRAGALKIYHECAEILKRELGVEPAPETSALYEQLRQAKRTLPTPQSKTHATPELPPLVGRQTEWQTLRDAWQQAVRGRATFVTIAGEAGIGKTRLAEELYLWAERQGIAAVRTRSYQAQGALAYGPIAELLQAEVINRRLSLLNKHQLTQVARLLPKLLAEQPDLTPPQPMTESWQRQQFFDALAHAILADGRPLLLLFDDLQWADGETLAWLHFLLRAAKDRPLLVVGTIRTGEIESDHPLPALLTSLRRDDLLTEIALSPLNAEEVQILAQSIQAATIAEDELTQLYADTEGNPLFVVESVRAGLDEQQASPTQADQMGLPPKIYAVIRARLSLLTPEAQAIANLAAVSGRSFTYHVLRAASSSDEEELVDLLDELLARQVIREQRIDAYDFSHDRIRDVVYNEISRTRRRLLHRRVAEALETLNAQDPEVVSGLLAEHYAQAGYVPKAIDYFMVASRRAEAQFSHEEALHHLARALAIVDKQEQAMRYHLLDARLRLHTFQQDADAWRKDLDAFEALIDGWPESGEPPLPERHAKLALYVHQYKLICSDLDEALHYGQQALQLARQCGELSVEAQALHGCGRTYWTLSAFDQAKEMLEQAAEKARTAQLDSIVAESLEHLMASYMFSGGEAERIDATLNECLAIYERAGDQKGIAGIYNKFGYLPIAQGVGTYDQARFHYDRALSLYQQIGFHSGAATVWRNLAVLHTCTGNYSAAERAIQQAFVLEETLEREDMIAVAQNYQGFSFFNQGRLIDAQRTQMAALEKLLTITHTHLGLKALTALGWIHFYRQEFDIARGYLEKALTHCQNINEVRQAGYTFTCLGHLLAAQNQLVEARDAYQQALDAHRRMEQPNRAMEPKAGLAYVDHLEGNQSLAFAQVDEILAYLHTHTLDRTEEGFYVYLLCYRILAATQDARADELRQAAYAQLQARAATIDHPEHRRLFWEAMPAHREIQAAVASFPRTNGQRRPDFD